VSIERIFSIITCASYLILVVFPRINPCIKGGRGIPMNLWKKFPNNLRGRTNNKTCNNNHIL
jgi:hypothetical protein